MKEHPILFSGPMVRAILSGKKTMTRRVVKELLPDTEWRIGQMGKIMSDHPNRGKYGVFIHLNDMTDFIPFPYGLPGDYLWVRETWAKVWDDSIVYRADYPGKKTHLGKEIGGPWRPSIFMPRWAPRITLEISSVRVERLQEITETDAISEGTQGGPTHPDFWVGAFEDLWDSINKKRHPWSSNPFVWVIEFKRIKP